MALSKLDVKFFGAIAVSRDTAVLGGRDFGGTKAKQLFQLLVLARGEPVPKDRLADQIWGESLPMNVNGTLETYVSVLRRRLTPADGDGRALITTAHEAYALPTDGYDLDLARFDELVRLADVAEPSARRRYLEDALELASGEVLADEPYSDWAIDERWRYGGRVIDTAIAASSAAMDDRDARSALEHAELAIGRDPLDERGYRAGLLALHALGRDRDAIALFDRYCAAAADEDGEASVSQELRDLRATIGRREAINLRPRGDGQLQVARAAAADPAPRRMLGRAAELDILGRALAATSDGGSELVLVEGERGIGKTTLLEAASREVGENVRVGWARCSELVSGIPYAALALALREVLGTSEVDVRSYPALAGVFPEMRVRSTRSAPRAVDTLEALVTLVMALAPLVLFLDDLQWADSDTLVALGYLGNRGPLRGVTIAGALRPEEVDERARGLAPAADAADPSRRARRARARAARDRRSAPPHRGASALRQPRDRKRRGWQALALGVGLRPLPRRGRWPLPAAQRGLSARGVVLGIASGGRARSRDGRGRGVARQTLPPAPARARRRPLPVPHEVDARCPGGQSLARLAQSARAAHRTRRPARAEARPA